MRRELDEEAGRLVFDEPGEPRHVYRINERQLIMTDLGPRRAARSNRQQGVAVQVLCLRIVPSGFPVLPSNLAGNRCAAKAERGIVVLRDGTQHPIDRAAVAAR